MRLRNEEKAVYNALKRRILFFFYDPVKTVLLIMFASCDFITLTQVFDKILKEAFFMPYPLAFGYSFALAIPPAFAGDALQKLWTSRGEGTQKKKTDPVDHIHKEDHSKKSVEKLQLILKGAVATEFFGIMLQVFGRLAHAIANSESVSITGAIMLGLVPAFFGAVVFLLYFASADKDVEDAKEYNQKIKGRIADNRIKAEKIRLGSTKDFGKIQMIQIKELMKACQAGADIGHDARVCYSQLEMARKNALDGEDANKMIVEPYFKKRGKETE